MTPRPTPLILLTSLLLAMSAQRVSAADAEGGEQDPYSLHPPAALIGRWDVTVEGPDGPYPSWFEVQQSGFKFVRGAHGFQFNLFPPQ